VTVYTGSTALLAGNANPVADQFRTGEHVLRLVCPLIGHYKNYG
jgi:hypothetical protein